MENKGFNFKQELKKLIIKKYKEKEINKTKEQINKETNKLFKEFVRHLF